MKSLPERRTETLDSSAFSDLQRLKRSLVLDLFLKQGAFWEMVRDLRKKKDITAPTGLPPQPQAPWQWPMDLLPPGAPDVPQSPPPEDEDLHDEEHEFRLLWWRELDRAIEHAIPERLSGSNTDGHVERSYWRTFVAACVLYDPPETDLLAFAKYHDPPAYAVVGPNGSIMSKADANFVVMRVPPVRTLRDPQLAADIEDRHWQRIIQEIGERFLRPLGLDVGSMVSDVMKNCPEILREWAEEHKQNEQRYYIEVNEHTTTAEVNNAFRTIAATQGNRKRRPKPKKDELVTVQAAILYERHNGPDPEHSDRRRKRWTYPKLARELGLPVEKKQAPQAGRFVEKEVSESAEAHVRLGKELLKRK